MQKRTYFVQPSVLKGFWLCFAFTLFYLALIVILPLCGLIQTIPFNRSFFDTILEPRVLSSLKVSFLCSFVASIINLVMGSIIAVVLVRYNFWGRNVLDSIIDLPFALPTAVAGIALTSLYAPNGLLGGVLPIAFTQYGIVMALVFTSLPFVVRTLQPVLEDFDKEIEEAAISLGASKWQVFYKVLLPYFMPAAMTGFSMAFARSLSEFGSVIFIAGNLPYKTEIAPLLIVSKLEQYDYAGASSIAGAMLLASFAILLVINYLQKSSK
jgi:sulfate/thiosulfate transport system permease protein